MAADDDETAPVRFLALAGGTAELAVETMAGVASAEDPAATIEPQRARLQDASRDDCG